jgi:type IV secretion system protein VirB6
LMIYLVSNFFGLSMVVGRVIPVTSTEGVGQQIRELIALFASKCGVALLMIYMYWKIFDLASALGGGLNLGNNIIGAIRQLYRDMKQGRSKKSEPRQPSASNQINQGSSSNAVRSGVSKAAKASQTAASAIRDRYAYSYNRFSSSRRANA